MSTPSPICEESVRHAAGVRRDVAARIRAFWAGSAMDRPNLTARIQRSPQGAEAAADAEAAGLVAPVRRVEREWEPAWHVEQARVRLASFDHVGESVPQYVPLIGSHLAVLSSLIGASYTYEGDSAWIEPIPDLLDREPIAWDENHPLLRRIDAILDAVVEAVGDRMVVSPPALVDPLTTLSTCRGDAALCIDLIERPEAVHAWVDALTEVSIRVHRRWWSRLRNLGQGRYTTSWTQCVAPGRFDAVQCDFGVNVSPEMFREFAVPSLSRLTRDYDFSLYHLDGRAQMRFLDDIASLPGLNGVQWNPEPGAGPILDHLDDLREIRGRGLSLLLHASFVPDVETACALVRELGPEGLWIGLPPMASRDEADDAERRIAEAAAP